MTGLKQKSKQTLDIIAGNPKISATQAYLETHSTANRVTAGTNVGKLLRNPAAQIYLKKHTDKAKQTIVQLMETAKDETKLNAAKDILDREYGKATQRVEQSTTGVILTIDLTSSLTTDTEVAQ
jgi:hypothetical protein